MGLLWLIIGITITYFVINERQRLKYNLENRLVNVNNTVIEAYENGNDLQKTVDFIHLFTGNTTLDPLRITVYDNKGVMIADNPEATILVYDAAGNMLPEFKRLGGGGANASVSDLSIDGNKLMVSTKRSADGLVSSFAALPYKGEVIDFLSIDPMVWIVVIILGILSSALAYWGVRVVCKNVYALRNLAQAISTDQLPDDADTWEFSDDELGDVSRKLLTLYRDKIHAEREKMHHERQIGMNVSHELNTPVGIIKGYLDTVLADDNMPDALKRKFLVRAQQNTDRLANLVSDVSMVMRLQEGGAIDYGIINFRDMTAQIAEDIAQGHIADNMTFICDIPEDCLIKGHESLLTNALFNLIYNAAQYSGGTRISLLWKGENDGMHRFEFADNGCGVDDEHLDRLFDLFYRVDTGRARKNGGAGLGLPLVHRIITAMGGDITVENAPGGGLRFTFTLPAA
ncbi:ATP-binding protein [uncultured Muribaculum sp.]|uniref:ATP-binding protein n=1 Tax=uncultured Muribaculum sp. TaxID=1918613 RepID=UPI0025A11162|nr:ATP-binding protein [uncultured Muribaculum sp.]